MFARALQPKLTEQARFASSFGRVWSAAFSPDGRQIVTTDDRGAQASGALVRELRRGSARPRYYAVAMSSGGKLVAAIDTKGELAHVWDAVTGAPIAELRNDASEFPALAFSADGRWLATTGGNDVRVFDARTRAHAIIIRGPRTVLEGPRSVVWVAHFDPSSRRVVGASPLCQGSRRVTAAIGRGAASASVRAYALASDGRALRRTCLVPAGRYPCCTRRLG